MGLMRRMYRTMWVKPLEDMASLKTVAEATSASKP
jgi:hypothetical protein